MNHLKIIRDDSKILDIFVAQSNKELERDEQNFYLFSNFQVGWFFFYPCMVVVARTVNNIMLNQLKNLISFYDLKKNFDLHNI